MFRVGRRRRDRPARLHGGNTLIFYIWGDNGSPAAARRWVLISEFSWRKTASPSTIKQHIDALEELGGPRTRLKTKPMTDNRYYTRAGPGYGSMLPTSGTKLLASHFGGTL